MVERITDSNKKPLFVKDVDFDIKSSEAVISYIFYNLLLVLVKIKI